MVYENLAYLPRVLTMDKNAERLGRLKPEEKVALAINMTDECMQICADGIRARCPDISEEELIAKLRERLEWTKRHRKHTLKP
jgi:hypothetical protein